MSLPAASSNAPALLFADEKGRVYEHPVLKAAVWDGCRFAPAASEDFALLGSDGELLLLPGRQPMAWDPMAGKIVRVAQVHFAGRAIKTVAVAAVPAMGWTRTHLPAYQCTGGSPMLPLYAYTAAASVKGQVAVAAALTDRHSQWNGRFFNNADLPALVRRRLKANPGNMVLQQLARCSMEYRCRTAQNVFYNRWEGGLPVSTTCNAACLGCISSQPLDSPVCAAQHRLDAVPVLDDIVAVAVEHLRKAKRPVISFGQGCEGEPTLQVELIASAVRRIRQITSRGLIHMNTNGSCPEAIATLAGAGLQSVRIALNSARPDTYRAYFRPRGYDFDVVCESIRSSVRKGLYTSLNLLMFPGVNDRIDEVDALLKLLNKTRPRAIQWRSLCIDPEHYLECLPHLVKSGPCIGTKAFMRMIKTKFPWLKTGNFNNLP